VSPAGLSPECGGFLRIALTTQIDMALGELPPAAEARQSPSAPSADDASRMPDPRHVAVTAARSLLCGAHPTLIPGQVHPRSEYPVL